MDKVRFGVIGYGNMGAIHAKSLFGGKVTNGVLSAVADTNPDRLKAAQTEFGNKAAYFATAEELIDSGTADAVIVAVPHYDHPRLSIYALEKGLHVVCEKPAGVHTKQVRELNKAAAEAKGLFTLMFNQRTNHLYRKMRQIIKEGELGEIKRINWIITDWYRTQSYYDSSDWRATWAGEGGGVLVNQSPHQLDLLCWIADMVPQSVRAHCHFGKWHDIEVEDDVTAYLEYANGATGVFITSTADCPGTNRLEIVGTLGQLVCENNTIRYTKLESDEREFNKTFKGGFGTPKSKVIDVQTDGKNPQHNGILNNFADAVLGKADLFVDGREGINGVMLHNAMLLSTWLDKKVEMPLDDEQYFTELNKRIATSKTKKSKNITLNTEGTYGT